MGYGTTFFFELALFAPTDEEICSIKDISKTKVGDLSSNFLMSPKAKGSNEARVASPEYNKTVLHLLVVDDSQMNRKMTRRMLESRGIIPFFLSLPTVVYETSLQSSQEGGCSDAR